ncbi:aldose 1-epimerase family protein [Janibacter sp. G1551]|uniref:aldose 1-epimerase family protein n=1 Tax=Janibacter sp. G1551 TaxID=3420440 RepID=UPI003CFD72EB
MEPAATSPGPGGRQWGIRHGDQTAVVVEVGGGLRTWTVAGRDVVAGYPESDIASAGRGQILMPWPNRIRDGRYRADGEEHQLALSEPRTGNASHGLVRWAAWAPSPDAPIADVTGGREFPADAPSAITVTHVLHPSPGYPWRLDLSVTYALGADGLAVTVAATNSGTGAAPFGFGAHPYVALGETPAAQARLTVPAAEVVTVDPERLLPTGTVPAGDLGLDLRAGEELGDRAVDHAFARPTRDADGRWRVRVGLDQGDVEVWGGTGLDWVQVFTGKSTPDSVPAGHPEGIAVEPLSCPPDSFNSGEGVVTLAPGESWSASWGMTLA